MPLPKKELSPPKRPEATNRAPAHRVLAKDIVRERIEPVGGTEEFPPRFRSAVSLSLDRSPGALIRYSEPAAPNLPAPASEASVGFPSHDRCSSPRESTLPQSQPHISELPPADPPNDPKTASRCLSLELSPSLFRHHRRKRDIVRFLRQILDFLLPKEHTHHS